MVLPNPNQTWSHSTCSSRELKEALADASVTAIESDILMGICDTKEKIPIMAHPPEKSSDLSFEKFMKMVQNSPKHLKLDIKEKECIQPILDILKEENASFPNRTIYFNADIFPGPGVRGEPPISPDSFIEPCLKYIQEFKSNNCAFSLGWRTDCRSILGYSKQDVQAMQDIIQQYSLLQAGVVLAINARVLVKSLAAFDELLQKESSIQLLIWTATGEPSISTYRMNKINRHFESIGCKDQIGFDCQVG